MKNKIIKICYIIILLITIFLTINANSKKISSNEITDLKEKWIADLTVIMVFILNSVKLLSYVNLSIFNVLCNIVNYIFNCHIVTDVIFYF